MEQYRNSITQLRYFDMKPEKLYIFITIVITSWLHVACSADQAASSPRERVSPEAIQQAISEAELLFKDRENHDKLREAIKKIAAVRDPDHRNYHVEWTFARYNYFLGKFTADEDEAEKALEAGRDAGRIARRVEPEKPDGHFWFGANLGELARRSPITVGLRSVGDIKESMHKVIELDPGYQGASAYDALGQVELATRLKGGDAHRAVEYLEKGVHLAPDNTNIRAHLAEAYLAVKRAADARRQIDHRSEERRVG